MEQAASVVLNASELLGDWTAPGDMGFEYKLTLEYAEACGAWAQQRDYASRVCALLMDRGLAQTTAELVLGYCTPVLSFAYTETSSSCQGLSNSTCFEGTGGLFTKTHKAHQADWQTAYAQSGQSDDPGSYMNEADTDRWSTSGMPRAQAQSLQLHATCRRDCEWQQSIYEVDKTTSKTKEKVFAFSPPVPFFVRVRVVDNQEESAVEATHTLASLSVSTTPETADGHHTVTAAHAPGHHHTAPGQHHTASALCAKSADIVLDFDDRVWRRPLQ
jgi:hypothetical protein